MTHQQLAEALKTRIHAAERGGPTKYHERNRLQEKLFVRERIRLVLDNDSPWIEDGALARTLDADLPGDAIVTGVGVIHGKQVAIIANDSTVKAGAWGRVTVQKILRMQDLALRSRIPVIYMQDSAGARLDEQFSIFLDRNHAGKIFYNQIQMSGVIPQVCVLFGPSPAGAAYLPAFCDFVVMVDGHSSCYIGSPRMAEMVTGERASMEQLGGARMHCSQSGLGDYLAANEEEAVAKVREFLNFMPWHWEEEPPRQAAQFPISQKPLEEIVPASQSAVFDMQEVIDALVDGNSWLELKALFARELIVGLARIGGRVVGVVANQPKVKGGVLFPDSADKGAWFIQLCTAYGIPLLFLQDISGFMVGSAVERQGIIRRGAKMLSALGQSVVPRISVLVRKAYGAGYMAMAGASFQSDSVIALPTAKAAIMGPEAAVNAIYYNKIQELPEKDRERFTEEKRAEYDSELDIMHGASEFFIDAVVPGERLRAELIERFNIASRKIAVSVPRRSMVIRG
ncbi:MAG: carboxylase [Sulfobacillus benefaciens]|uniref:Carboxylase n=1 Tax=Sulfobacillus benefaciens TaxID=453960 RepID=A0A2T2XJR9_9FIRM|nr:MAG: carboxylase [Sulfobacillus benefaciens]